ncbi:hypothetical protein E4U31_006466 [Claviceps sp. LM219 group G6]|nr:hypothetical protein E4U31_006466 [Claviceps sp. LM219 group G6]
MAASSLLFRIRALVKRELAFEVEDIERDKKLQEDRVRKSPASRILNKDQRIGSEMLMEDVRGTGLGRTVGRWAVDEKLGSWEVAIWDQKQLCYMW